VEAAADLQAGQAVAQEGPAGLDGDEGRLAKADAVAASENLAFFKKKRSTPMGGFYLIF
jgi:hypothetical protein